MDWEGTRATFLETAAALPALVAAIDDFTSPGLGVWDNAGLAGHTLRGIRTVLTYLDHPAPQQCDLEDAADYLATAMARRDRDPAAADAAVAARGAQELSTTDPDRYVEAFTATAAEAARRLGDEDGTRVVATPIGGIRLDDYLRTRLLEITVHGLDLASANGIAWTPPTAAVDDGLELLVATARRLGRAPGLLAALTGRTSDAAAAALPVLR